MQEHGAASGNGSRRLMEAGKRVANEATDLGESIQDLAGRARDSVVHLMQERPYLMLLAAAGTGYLVAGGLASPFTRAVVGMGGRFLVQRAIGQMMAGQNEPF